MCESSDVSFVSAELCMASYDKSAYLSEFPHFLPSYFSLSRCPPPQPASHISKNPRATDKVRQTCTGHTPSTLSDGMTHLSFARDGRERETNGRSERSLIQNLNF